MCVGTINWMTKTKVCKRKHLILNLHSQTGPSSFCVLLQLKFVKNHKQGLSKQYIQCLFQFIVCMYFCFSSLFQICHIFSFFPTPGLFVCFCTTANINTLPRCQQKQHHVHLYHLYHNQSKQI